MPLAFTITAAALNLNDPEYLHLLLHRHLDNNRYLHNFLHLHRYNLLHDFLDFHDFGDLHNPLNYFLLQQSDAFYHLSVVGDGQGGGGYGVAIAVLQHYIRYWT